jgi:hypothetical protein
MRCRRLASLASDQDWGLDVGKRQEGGLGADEEQASVLLVEDLLQRALDRFEIGRSQACRSTRW